MDARMVGPPVGVVRDVLRRGGGNGLVADDVLPAYPLCHTGGSRGLLRIALMRGRDGRLEPWPASQRTDGDLGRRPRWP